MVGTDAYKHEMTEDEHRELLVTIQQCQGKVMLSGYPNPLYDQQLADWRRKDFRIDNKAAAGQSKRKMTESVWMNF
jgi:DNA adenine methylase